MSSFLFSEYRQRVLNLLLLHPEKSYHVREIARLTNTSAGTLHRELSKLAGAEVLVREISGNQVYYRANIHYPIFNELTSILRKTSGLADILANTLAPLAKKIDVAFIFGSLAQGTENAGSDVDILIIGEASFTEVVKILYSAQSIIGREINPKVYSKNEWRKLVKDEKLFAKEIIKKPKLFLIGTVNDIG